MVSRRFMPPDSGSARPFGRSPSRPSLRAGDAPPAPEASAGAPATLHGSPPLRSPLVSFGRVAPGEDEHPMSVVTASSVERDRHRHRRFRRAAVWLFTIVATAALL